MLTVGQRLHLERVRRNVSQTELSRKCGIAQANLSNIENGKQDIMVSTFLQICLALDIQPSSVLDASVKRPANPRFSRARLENIAAAVVGNREPASKVDRDIARLLRQTILPNDGRTSSKQARLRWADLRRQLTDGEIDTLRQRIADALQRNPDAKKSR
jgi:DNA-binding Xre family transcriptional regulator